MCWNHLKFLKEEIRQSAKKEKISYDTVVEAVRDEGGFDAGENVFRSACVVSAERLTVMFKVAQRIQNKRENQQVTYVRREGETFWSKVTTPDNVGFPLTLAICRETDVPVRTVKNRTQFRRGMLKHIRDALKPLHNMILF